MAQNVNHLYKFRDIFYYRVRIPKDLLSFFDGKEDFKRSLRTKSLKQARRLLRVWDYRTEGVFTTMRTGMLTREQIRKLAEEFKHEILRDIEENRHSGGNIPRNPDDLSERLELEGEFEDDAREALAYNDFKKINSSVEYVIREHGLNVEKGSLEYTALARALLRELIEVHQIEQQRMVGNYQNGYDDRETELAPATLAPAAPPSPLLSVTIGKFMEDQHRKESANKSTLAEYASICKLFLNVVEDRPVQDISRDTLRRYLDILKKLPPHINKRRLYQGKTIQEILTMNEGGETISISTVEKSLTVIKTLFAWMTAEGLIDKNPSDVLKAPKKEVRPDEERNAYSTDDLKKLVAALKAEENGKLKDRPDRYWIPLISLFSGMRLNEICQLHTADIVTVQDVPCFKIQSDDEGIKKLKTAAAYRTVPIHRALIYLGFMEYVKECSSAKQPRLWMKLTRDSKGKYNKNFSNWFLGTSYTAGFLRTYVTTDDKLDFHSFRHTFINAMKQSDVDEVKIAELVGHTNSSMTTGRYGKRYEIAKMKETVDGLVYQGVDFSPLKGVASSISSSSPSASRGRRRNG